MFASGANYQKLKTNLRLAINRLKLSEKKKTELALKARKEIADFLAIGKTERAKIRVEHIIREDYLVEAMEVVEMYCDLLLARFGLIQQMKDLDEGLAEAISSLIWVAPRLQTDIAEVKVISEQLTLKYGKPYAQACREQAVGTVSEKLIHKLSVQAPPKILVEKYLVEIAKNYNIEYEPDPQIMRENEWGEDPLINLNELRNDLGGHGGGATGGGGTMNIPPYPESSQKPFAYPQKNSSVSTGNMTFMPSLLLTNPQSLNNCFREFSDTVRSNDPDVVAVCETWFSDSHPASECEIDGYSMFHDDREERKGGGVALYIKTRLVPYSPSILVPPVLECVWAALGSSLFICSLYHAPRSPTGKLLMEHLVNTVLDLRSRSSSVKVIIIGDFNELPHQRLYSSLKLQNLVREPTHQNSAIDLVLTDAPELFSEVRLLPPIGRSQHHCVFVLPVEKVGFSTDDLNLPGVPDQPYVPSPGGPPPPDMSADTMSNNFKHSQGGMGGPYPGGMGAGVAGDWDELMNASPPPPYSSSMEHHNIAPASAPPGSIPPNVPSMGSRHNLPAAHFPPDLSANNGRAKESNTPKPAPRSKFDEDPGAMFNLPELPSVPDTPGDAGRHDNNSSSKDDEIDFDDLNKRFEELKRKK